MSRESAARDALLHEVETMILVLPMLPKIPAFDADLDRTALVLVAASAIAELERRAGVDAASLSRPGEPS